jgi:hypothetical protein
MICDLCRQRAIRVVRVDSWIVCKWCVTNKVLAHAFDVKSDIAKRRKAVGFASLVYRHEVRKQLQLANSDAQPFKSKHVLDDAVRALTEYELYEEKQTRQVREVSLLALLHRFWLGALRFLRG